MKKILICVAVILAAICANCYAMASSKDASQGAAVEEKAPFKGWNKLDLRTRDIYKAHPISEEWSDVIIKVMPPIKPRQTKKLEKAGFKVGAVMNTIMTGKIQMSHLEELTDLSFVLYVEAAMPLSQKKK